MVSVVCSNFDLQYLPNYAVEKLGLPVMDFFDTCESTCNCIYPVWAAQVVVSVFWVLSTASWRMELEMKRKETY